MGHVVRVPLDEDGGFGSLIEMGSAVEGVGIGRSIEVGL